MTTTTNKIGQAFKNPSYDKSLSPKERLQDFLMAYHIVLHGVKAHEPFDLRYEGKPTEWCDTDAKERFIEFVELIIKDALQKEREETIEACKKVIEKYIPTDDMGSYGGSSAMSDEEICEMFINGILPELDSLKEGKNE